MPVAGWRAGGFVGLYGLVSDFAALSGAPFATVSRGRRWTIRSDRNGDKEFAAF